MLGGVTPLALLRRTRPASRAAACATARRRCAPRAPRRRRREAVRRRRCAAALAAPARAGPPAPRPTAPSRPPWAAWASRAAAASAAAPHAQLAQPQPLRRPLRSGKRRGRRGTRRRQAAATPPWALPQRMTRAACALLRPHPCHLPLRRSAALRAAAAWTRAPAALAPTQRAPPMAQRGKRRRIRRRRGWRLLRSHPPLRRLPRRHRRPTAQLRQAHMSPPAARWRRAAPAVASARQMKQEVRCRIRALLFCGVAHWPLCALRGQRTTARCSPCSASAVSVPAPASARCEAATAAMHVHAPGRSQATAAARALLAGLLGPRTCFQRHGQRGDGGLCCRAAGLDGGQAVLHGGCVERGERRRCGGRRRAGRPCRGGRDAGCGGRLQHRRLRSGGQVSASWQPLLLRWRRQDAPGRRMLTQTSAAPGAHGRNAARGGEPQAHA